MRLSQRGAHAVALIGEGLGGASASSAGAGAAGAVR